MRVIDLLEEIQEQDERYGLDVTIMCPFCMKISHISGTGIIDAREKLEEPPREVMVIYRE